MLEILFVRRLKNYLIRTLIKSIFEMSEYAQVLEDYILWRIEEVVAERVRIEWESAENRIKEAVADAIEAQRHRVNAQRAITFSRVASCSYDCGT
jgi:hypothetical protein